MGLQPMAVWLRSASLAPFTVMVGEGRPSTSFSAATGASAHGCLVAIRKPRSLYRHGRRRPTIHEFANNKHGRKKGSRLGQSIIKIIPARIGRDDQSNLPSPTPAFQVFLPLDRGANVAMALKEDEASQAVALRGALYQPLSMLPRATW